MFVVKARAYPIVERLSLAVAANNRLPEKLCSLSQRANKYLLFM